MLNEKRKIEQDKQIPSDLWKTILKFYTENRRDKVKKACDLRTKHIRLVVQDVHHPHNVSACLRSAEAFGIQNVDVVTLKKNFRASSVAKGVSKWLHIHNWSSVKECAANLKSQNYQIAAAVPSTEANSLDTLAIEKPIALLFGNEHEGISSDWENHIDCVYTIPMAGLVESLNISVSAAICLHYLSKKAKKKYPANITSTIMKKITYLIFGLVDNFQTGNRFTMRAKKEIFLTKKKLYN